MTTMANDQLATVHRWRMQASVTSWRLENVASGTLHVALWIMDHAGGVNDHGEAIVEDVTVHDIAAGTRLGRGAVERAVADLLRMRVVAVTGDHIVRFYCPAWDAQ